MRIHWYVATRMASKKRKVLGASAIEIHAGTYSLGKIYN